MMVKGIQVVVLAVLAAIVPANVVSQTSLASVATENVIRQLEREWETALKADDQATIDRIVAPDCLFVSSTGDLSSKAQADAERRAYVKLLVSATTQMNVRVFGETAIVIGTKGLLKNKMDTMLKAARAYSSKRDGHCDAADGHPA